MQRKLIPVILLWLFTSLFVAGLSELHPDEAYYWMYSNFLDWGYFDHPPMVAVMTSVGYMVLPSELGVRLMVVIMVAAVLWIIPQYNKTIMPENPWTYGMIIFSIVCIAVLGFTNTPDGYLLFFTALYFFIYKEYLEGKESWGFILLWGAVMSFMLYSKYHGILVIGFTVLSNPKLLTKQKFWVAGIFGAILFTPHLWWQYSNDFPSIQYHLVDRSASSYNLKYTTEYILGQLFYFGPFVGFLFYFYTYRTKADNQFEKTLKSVTYGFLLFFLIMTFQGRIEANWTVVIVIPFIYFTLKYIKDNPFQKRIFLYVAIPSILILLIARIQIIYPILKIPGDRTNEMRGHATFTEEVYSSAGNKSVVANTYQNASILSFYSKKFVTSLNVSSRKNQYDFWDLDQSLYGEKIYFVNNHLKSGDEIINERGQTLYGTSINNPTFLRGVFLELDSYTRKDDTVDIKLHFKINKRYSSIYGTDVSYVDLAYRDDKGNYISLIGTAIIPEEIYNGQKINIAGKIEGPIPQNMVILVHTRNLGIWSSLVINEK